MDSMRAFAMGQANKGQTLKVFDWDAAATLIRDGQIVDRDDTYTYLASTWATPELHLDGEIVVCWRYEDAVPGWDADTYWPDSARAILAGGS